MNKKNKVQVFKDFARKIKDKVSKPALQENIVNNEVDRAVDMLVAHRQNEELKQIVEFLEEHTEVKHLDLSKRKTFKLKDVENLMAGIKPKHSRRGIFMIGKRALQVVEMVCKNGEYAEINGVLTLFNKPVIVLPTEHSTLIYMNKRAIDKKTYNNRYIKPLNEEMTEFEKGFNVVVDVSLVKRDAVATMKLPSILLMEDN